MKKGFVLLITLFIFSLFLCSCTQNQVNIITVSDTDSLRTLLGNKETDATWTKEIEENRLLERIDVYKNSSGSIKLDKYLYMSNKTDCLPVYPYIENFASLDISSLPKDYRLKVIDFADSFIDGFENIEKLKVNPKYSFNLIFFRHDLIQNWREIFNENYPEKKDDDKIKLFRKYVIGEPFIAEDIIQIPVRFYRNKSYLDIELVYTLDENSYLNQIDIIKWGKTNAN